MYNSGFLVVDISPANKETNVSINKGIEVKFSFDMLVDTITASTMVLSKVNGATVDTKIIYDRKARTAYIKPVSLFEKGVQYRLTVVGGLDGIMAVTGSILPENKVYQFTTTNDVSVSTPSHLTAKVKSGRVTLNWLTPDAYNPDKDLEYKPYISTSALDPDTDPGAVLWPLQGDALGQVKGTSIEATRVLPEGTYCAYLHAVNGTSKSAWVKEQFIVEGAAVNPPSAPSFPMNGFIFEVHATYPEADSVGLSADGIKILFTEDIDVSTISTSSVYIVKAVKPKALSILDLMTKYSPAKSIDFTIGDFEQPNLLSLNVDLDSLEANTEYTVLIREGVKSVSGSSLGEAYSLSFISRYTPLFGDAERIRDDIKIFLRNVSDRVLYRYMHDVSLTALDTVSRVISPFNEANFLSDPPRYVDEYVRYQVGYDLVVNAIVQETSGIGSSRTLGDLTIQPNQNISQVNQILANLKARIKRWEDELHGHHNRGYAKPTTAVKSETGGVYPDFLTRTELVDPSEG